MRDDPIRTKAQTNSLVIAQNAYMSLDPKITAHNWNLAVLGASDEQFRALVKANLGQGFCNYVVLTSSEASYNEISAVLVHHGYNVSAYDLTADVCPDRDPPADLLGRSEASAVFFLFDPSSEESCTQAGTLIDSTLRAIYLARSKTTGPGRPPHIQFFLSGLDRLPAMPGFPRALITARAAGLGICFSSSGHDSLHRAYPAVSKELLDGCDIRLLYGSNRTVCGPSAAERLAALFRRPTPPKHCELRVKGLPPRRVIPFERSDRS